MRFDLRQYGLLALLLAACGGEAEAPRDGGRGSAESPTGKPAAGEDADNATPATARTPAPFCASAPTGREFIVGDRQLFDAITPASFDYLALRGLDGGFDTPDPALVTLAERGARCANASVAQTCNAAYDELTLNALFSAYVFYTRGDKVGIVTSSEEAIDLLGTVDSVADAYFVARLSGYYHQCSGENAAVYRVVDDGFEIVTHRGGCGGPEEQVVLHVSANGTLEEVSRKTTGPERGCL